MKTKLEQLQNDALLVKHHIQSHKTAYTLGAGVVLGVYLQRKFGISKADLAKAVSTAKAVAVDEHYTEVWAKDLVPLALDHDQFLLWQGALVQAGKITQDEAKTIWDLVHGVTDMCKAGTTVAFDV